MVNKIKNGAAGVIRPGGACQNYQIKMLIYLFGKGTDGVAPPEEGENHHYKAGADGAGGEF